ncbi:MAG: divalent-cation tolerance protein CutA, partial [Pseudomonadota bacterium]
FQPITSIYWWESKVQEEGETSFILKTRADLVDALTQRVKALHSYACPCVVALPVAAGNPAFLSWIENETRKD